ncbi:RHS repeat-associated core domain-containing protein, partial [Pseudoduganella rhizocola]|uniref:RHS repeat-associated core domain-containing protein n=1 Tax=Pseudoduganella rhizocola TaxID=3382643 RepID=UPI0038B68471
GVTDNRGFTGHEMLDQLDLVHMNGRIYEPLIARFLSADPLIQDPTHSQSYNRYAYVWNNPANLMDPTGFAGVEAGKPSTVPTPECNAACQQSLKELERCKQQGNANCGYTIFNQSITRNARDKGGIGTASANNKPSVLQQFKNGYDGTTRSVMYPETVAETAGRYVHNVVEFGTNLLPGSSLPDVGIEAGKGNYGTAAVLLSTELLGPIGGEVRAARALEKTVAGEAKGITAIGRMEDLQRVANDSGIDSWAKSGRIPGAGEKPVTWAENRRWLQDRIDRGDSFIILTNPSSLPSVRGGYVPGSPNGYFTARELQYLNQQGIKPKYVPGN